LKHYRAALALAKNDPDLQQTVLELERSVEPPKPPASADGLSFEQMESEFLQHSPPPAIPAPRVRAAPKPSASAVMDWSESPVSTGPGSERDLALQRIAALEQWLDAIHVSRPQPRA
jgi:hypothetical protein